MSMIKPLQTCFNICFAIITRLTRIISDGAEPLNSLQGGSASGSMPRMSPPTATGGNPRLPQQARRSRGRTTGYTKPLRTTSQGDTLERRGSPHSTSKQTCMSSMKTTSVASKKHICNQNNPLKSEDTSAFDPT